MGYLNLKTAHGINQSNNSKNPNGTYKPTKTDNIKTNTRGEIVATKKAEKDNKCCIM